MSVYSKCSGGINWVAVNYTGEEKLMQKSGLRLKQDCKPGLNCKFKANLDFITGSQKKREKLDFAYLGRP